MFLCLHLLMVKRSAQNSVHICFMKNCCVYKHLVILNLQTLVNKYLFANFVHWIL